MVNIGDYRKYAKEKSRSKEKESSSRSAAQDLAQRELAGGLRRSTPDYVSYASREYAGGLHKTGGEAAASNQEVTSAINQQGKSGSAQTSNKGTGISASKTAQQTRSQKQSQRSRRVRKAARRLASREIAGGLRRSSPKSIQVARHEYAGGLHPTGGEAAASNREVEKSIQQGHAARRQAYREFAGGLHLTGGEAAASNAEVKTAINTVGGAAGKLGSGDIGGAGNELLNFGMGVTEQLQAKVRGVAGEAKKTTTKATNNIANEYPGAASAAGTGFGSVFAPSMGPVASQAIGEVVANNPEATANAVGKEVSGGVKSVGDVGSIIPGLATVEGGALVAGNEALKGEGPFPNAVGGALGNTIIPGAGQLFGQTAARLYKPGERNAGNTVLAGAAEAGAASANSVAENPRASAEALFGLGESIANTERNVALSAIEGSGPGARAAGQTLGSVFGGPMGVLPGEALASAYKPGGKSSVDTASEAVAGSGPVQYAANNPFEVGGRIGGNLLIGAALGVGTSKAGTLGSDVFRTFGGTEIEEGSLSNFVGNFPGAKNPSLYENNPAAAVRTQSADFTPEAVNEYFAQHGVNEGSVLKKALPVEPEGPGVGVGGFSSPPASAQQYESPGAFFGPELSTYFLRAGGEESRFSPVPGLPSFGGKPTGVLAKTSVENTAASDMAGFNSELLARSGEAIAIAKPRGAVNTNEIEAVVPPGTQFNEVGDQSVLNKLGFGSEFYTRINGWSVPFTDIQFGGRRVPLRTVAGATEEAAGEAISAGGATAETASESQPLSYYLEAPQSVESRPLPLFGDVSGGSGANSSSSTSVQSSNAGVFGMGYSGGSSPSYNGPERQQVNNSFGYPPYSSQSSSESNGRGGESSAESTTRGSGERHSPTYLSPFGPTPSSPVPSPPSSRPEPPVPGYGSSSVVGSPFDYGQYSYEESTRSEGRKDRRGFPKKQRAPEGQRYANPIASGAEFLFGRSPGGQGAQSVFGDLGGGGQSEHILNIFTSTGEAK